MEPDAEGEHVRVGADARIPEQIPRASDYRARLEDGVRRPRTVGLHIVGGGDAGQAGATTTTSTCSTSSLIRRDGKGRRSRSWRTHSHGSPPRRTGPIQTTGDMAVTSTSLSYTLNRVLSDLEPNGSEMASRNRSNPLALAVLICLYERPMHPYEVATTLRQRQKHESVRLNYGSLYAVVASLEKRGLIAPQETERDGSAPGAHRLPPHRHRPDRGARLAHRPHLHAGEGLPGFEAALSFLPALPPDDVVALLRRAGPAPRARAGPGRRLARARREARCPGCSGSRTSSATCCARPSSPTSAG